MRRLLFILTLLSVGLLACGQTGTGWYPERKKVNFRDSTYFTKSANFLVPFRIGGTAVTSNAQELNILDGGLITYTELNNLLNSTSNIQTQLNAKQATLVSGTNIRTVNGTSLLGSGNIVIEGGEGGSMVYPGAGIPLSTGTAWGTSITNNSVQWDSAYVGRYRWSGTAIGLNAATGRTSLGGTTIGQNIFTLTNPDAIRFLRINADNTVTALSAANFKTALSFTASDVSLGNVTNESKTTMFTDPTFTGTAINAGNAFLALGTYTAPISSIRMADGQGLRWANSAWGGATSGVSLTKVSGYDTIALMGGDFMISDGDLNTTDSRVNSGYFTNLYATSLTATNAITGSITGNAATVTGFTRNSGTLTLSGGHGITLTTTGTTTVTLPTSGTLSTNPMTAAGDVIIGGASGVPTRLPATTNGYVLTLSAGAPVWAAAADADLETRIDSIVAVLSDTMNIETLLQIDLDTDTVADLSEVRLRLAVADTAAMLTNYALTSEIGAAEMVYPAGSGIPVVVSGTSWGTTIATEAYDTENYGATGTGDIVLSTGATVTNMTIDDVSPTELSYLDGITSSIKQNADTIPIFVFGLGSGVAADTAVFNDNAIAGSFYNAGSDTLKITSLMGVLAEGSGTETIAVQVSWHATFKSGSATNLNSSALTVNSITTGTSDTSFANDKIPPGVFVWCTLSGASAGNKPSLLILTMSGYKISKY